MTKQIYKVIEEFDENKDYGIKIRRQYQKCLSTLKKGETITPPEHARKHLNEFTLKPREFQTNREIVSHACTIGRKIGVLQEVSLEERGICMTRQEFDKLESIQYCTKQLRGSRYKNVDPRKESGTADAYSYRLWKWNNWIHGKSFEFYTEIQTDIDTYKRVREKIKLDGIEQLLNIAKQPFNSKPDIIRVIKEYLLDPMHEGKRASTINLEACAIRAYFEKNDCPMNFRFDPKVSYKSLDEETELGSLTLDELMAILSEGKPSLTQKAAILCKFHRGLDTSTLVDRFNFQAWAQLVAYFGTVDYHAWDISKCPVPIKLTRMKRDVPHTGFLDIDAIVALQKYLDYRRELTGKEMQDGDALFLNAQGQPIVNHWIGTGFRRLAKTAGLKVLIPGYKACRYRANSHETRDLLKSTLIDCGVRSDLADHFIGHKPKDSYEKQATLFPDTLRKEYSKASKRINVFSNFANMVKGHENTEELKQQIKQLQKEQLVHIETQKAMLQVLKEKQIIP